MNLILVNLAGLVLIGLIVWWFWLSKPKAQRAASGVIDVMGEGGGYVFSNCHNIQPDVPVENVLTMFQHARGYVPSWAK